MPTTTPSRILLVDSDASSRRAIADLIRSRGHDVDGAEDGASALERVGTRLPRLVLTKLELSDMQGVALMKELRVRKCNVPVVVVSSFESVVGSLASREAGAKAYVHEPSCPEGLLQAVDDALLPAAPRTNAASWWNESRTSTSMHAVERAVHRLAPTTTPVLLQGEQGTGKEQTARVLHAVGPRAAAPFVILHCAGLSDARLETELFGTEARPARELRQGALDRAAGGTLLLEAISTLSLAMQARLLELLQEGSYRHVGGVDAHALRARIVATCDHDLAIDVAEGTFRQDLHYRLAVSTIVVPPLRERGDDVVRLAEALLRHHTTESPTTLDGFSPEAIVRLKNHAWPGNVRELEHCVARAVLLCEGTRIDVCDLPADLTSPPATDPIRVPGATLAEIERHAILTALDATGGSTTKAAQLLDISIRTIQYRLHQYGISRSK